MPSPKFHCHDVILPLPALLWLLKFTRKGEQPVKGLTVKRIIGFALTVIYCVFISESVFPSALRITNLKVYAPSAKYVVEGFCMINIVPLPRSHFHCTRLRFD